MVCESSKEWEEGDGRVSKLVETESRRRCCRCGMLGRGSSGWMMGRGGGGGGRGRSPALPARDGWTSTLSGVGGRALVWKNWDVCGREPGRLETLMLRSPSPAPPRLRIGEITDIPSRELGLPLGLPPLGDMANVVPSGEGWTRD